MFRKSPFHEGEKIIQKRAKQVLPAQINGLSISNIIPPGGKEFIAQLQMVVISSMDPSGKVWASILFGKHGFFFSEDAQHLSFNKAKSRLSDSDPLWENIKNNIQIGLLFIDLDSRIRLRVNGQIQSLSGNTVRVKVVQAYPNCPKYIQRRQLTIDDNTIKKTTDATKTGVALSSEQQAMIRDADMFFVASAHPENGLDCSHRGGQSGFVQVRNHTCLRIPDYAGNSLFNTLGNFQSYPFAGLIFIDFHKQRFLQLSGRTKIIWALNDSDNLGDGTQRFWAFYIESWNETTIPFSVSWKFLNASPFNPSLLIPAISNSLSLRVEKVTQLTPRIKSFVLSDVEGNNLPTFEPGAHLPITIVNKNGLGLMRQYSLVSDYSDTAYYEIAVLEDSLGRGGSSAMHNNVHEGDLLQAKTPLNNFSMFDNAKHTVLIAGGIGITPFISMARKLSAENLSFEVHYTVRSHKDFALLETIKKLTSKNLYCYTSDKTETVTANLDLQLLLGTPKAETHVYICGPKSMIEAALTISRKAGWLSEQIHFESFGIKNLPEDKPIKIFLTQSKKTINVAANSSILDSLLDAGIDIPYQCKRGECSMCMTKVLSGKPEHRDLCLSDEQRKSTMCVCVSRAINEDLTLEL